MKRQVVSYLGSARFIHWLIALIVIGMLAGSFFLKDLPKQYQPSAFMLHKSFGLTVLFLMVIRLMWILYNGKPALPASVPIWEKLLSRFVQYGLYFFVILMPLIGWVMSVAANRIPSYFGMFSLSLPWIVPSDKLAKLMVQFHSTTAWIIIVLLVLHVAGALKHHFINKDDVLRRMLPSRRVI